MSTKQQGGIAIISDANYILFPGVAIQVNITRDDANNPEWEAWAGKGKKVVFALKFEALDSASKTDVKTELRLLYGYYEYGTTAEVTEFKRLSSTNILFHLSGLKKCLIKNVDLQRQKSGFPFAVATEVIEQNSNIAVAAPTQKVLDEIGRFRTLMAAFQNLNSHIVRDELYARLVNDLGNATNAKNFQKEIDIIRQLIYLIASRYVKKYLAGDLRSLQELLSRPSFEEELAQFNGLLGYITKTHTPENNKVEPPENPVATTTPEDPIHKARLDKLAGRSGSLKPEVKTYLEKLLESYSAPRKEQDHGNTDTRQKYCALIDSALEYPWGIRTEDCFDFDLVQKKFDQELYGLEPIKRVMYSIIAVMKQRRRANLTGSQGNVLLLIGEPGVGKTASIKVLAKAIGRNFQSVDLGGVNRQENIKGQEFTFVGSVPGLINDAVKRSGSINPVIALEEIDKMTAVFGDPSAALMAILDPERNQTIRDMYYPDPIYFDYSEVLFVCTANSLKNIYPPLLNRMRPIEVPGYNKEDKIKIAAKYLIPKWAAETGLDKLTDYSVDESSIVSIIDTYAEREKGVRRLEDKIEELFEAIAVKREYAGLMLDCVNITPENLAELLTIPPRIGRVGY